MLMQLGGPSFTQLGEASFAQRIVLSSTFMWRGVDGGAWSILMISQEVHAGRAIRVSEYKSHELRIEMGNSPSNRTGD
jgi:hypothetical protein